MALCPHLPTTTESNYIRSLYLCPRHVWECSCVHPQSTFTVSAPRWQMWDQNCSATLNYICWQSSSLAAGCWGPVPPLQTDVGNNLLAHTCTSFPNLTDCWLKNLWLQGLPATIKASRISCVQPSNWATLGIIWHHGRGGRGERGGRKSSLRFDTSCLNFNYLIKDLNSAVNSSTNGNY